jgi:SAM-dependent methyltransferase
MNPTLESWPGAERRNPPRSDRHYLMLKPLAVALEAEIGRRLAGRSGLRVLDIGCGMKPYYPLFEPYAASYWGIDAEHGPQVDQVAVGEHLPFADGSFDVVLCTQVLEHVQDPTLVVSEIFRVLAPEGVALASTHGVFLYHPNPVDLWRWTIAGLERLFETAAPWQEISVIPNGEAVACLGFIACQYLDELGRQRLHSDRLRRAMLRTVNEVAERLDRHFPPRARGANPGSLSSNFLVSARR